MAERVVETRAELPFIGDHVVYLSYNQAAQRAEDARGKEGGIDSAGLATDSPFSMTNNQPCFELVERAPVLRAPWCARLLASERIRCCSRGVVCPAGLNFL